MEFGYLLLGFVLLMLLSWLGGPELVYLVDLFVGSLWPDQKRLPSPTVSLAIFGFFFWLLWLPFLVITGFLALVGECSAVREDQPGHSADSQGC
jgi:hypothetical protein